MLSVFLTLHRSGHYMYRPVVTVSNAQWLLHVPRSGHYTYRAVVTIRTAQWSLYVPHSGHYTYNRLTFSNCTFCSGDYFTVQH